MREINEAKYNDKVLKAHGLESYMVRKLKAIRLWIMAKYLLALIFPPIVLELIELLEFVQDVAGRF